MNDDGVFGLQRGFKKAGVNTIMMSLWEVDDEATQVLMSKFYSNLISGMSKRKAFVNAQHFLRTTQNNKFDNPRFWAAFILLDAFE
jgi:CHAT domain-containing protein